MLLGRLMNSLLIRQAGLALILILTLHFQTVSAQGILQGLVTDMETGLPLPDSNINIVNTLLGSSANSEGKFKITRIPAGKYAVYVSRIGYRAISKTDIAIKDGQVKFIRIALVETAIEMDPVVIMGNKVEQRLDDSPVSISVVSARDIRENNPQNLKEALENAPGIHFIGSQINLRGSTGYTFGVGNKVLLLLDGIPVYASDTGEFNWDMILPEDVKRIEVLKGAGSTLWGAAALGGVVNVITKSPDVKGRINISTSAGKYDRPFYKEWEWTDQRKLFYAGQTVNFSKQFSRFGFRLSGGHAYSTGYNELGRQEKYNLTSKINYRFANGIIWTGYGAFSQIDRGYFIQWKGQNDPYEVDETSRNNYAKTNQLNVYTKLDIPISAQLAFSLRASFVRTLMGNQFGNTADFRPAFGQGAEFQAFWMPLTGHVLTIGLQFQLDAGNTKYFGSHRGYFLGPYLQDDWKVNDRLQISLGLRYDRYQLIDQGGEDLFSPRAGFNWKFGELTHVRGSVGSGFRAATMVERFLELSVMNFHIIKNEALKAERSWAFDLGIRHYFTSDWNIDISLFDNEYVDLIEAHLNLIRGYIQFRNIARARIRGIEATSNFSHSLQLFGRSFVTGLQASFTGIKHEDINNHEPLPYRPEILANIKCFLKFQKTKLQIDYRYASRIEMVKVYPINDRVPMKFIDLRFSRSIGRYNLHLGVKNLLQYNYAPMESNLMPMRTFNIGLEGRF